MGHTLGINLVAKGEILNAIAPVLEVVCSQE
jgi:hypothetical protein